MLELIQQLDEGALWWIAQHLRMAWLDPLVMFYTNLGNGGLCFIAVALLLLAFRQTRKAGATALTALAFGAVVTNLTIKPLITRPRPWVVMEDFVCLVTSSDPNSFPSGHTTAAFAFGVALFLTVKPKWAKAGAPGGGGLMGWSRVGGGGDVPPHVVTGAVIGTCCGILASWVVRRVSERCSRQ